MDRVGRIFSIVCSVFIVAAFAIVWMGHKAHGQEDRHSMGHNDYQGWASGVTTNCCNNQDCHWLEGKEVREKPDRTEVLISGEWCPVLSKHFITRGKSPDWNKFHACIREAYETDGGDVCQRLLCFSGRGGV